MERGFNFKLLVPPRVNPIPGQVSTVKPQEIVEDGGCFMQALQQGYNKCLDKESNMPFPSMNTVVPTKPTRSDVFKMKVVPPMENEETNCKPSQLYSKLFEEVQKVKYWKVKVDSEAVQKDRKLQENKRTIETQRKAIQELQFGNESLSIKLEDQISENDDLQNKNNATRNLCNILKDTFERSAEKIHLFESEREETHHLFMENSETIQRMNSAFESLRIQAETDRHEMLKVKEDLEEFAVLKEKFEKEFSMKEEEESRKAIATALESNKEENAKVIAKKDSSLEELNKIKDQQADKLVQIQATAQEFQTSLTVEIQRAKELELKLTAVTEELHRKNLELGKVLLGFASGELKSLNVKVEEQGQDTENLQKKLEESCGDLQAELSKKDKQMKAVESKLSNLKIKLESKTKVQDEYQKEINKLKEESENVQRSNEEECKNLLDDLETKSTSETELQKKVQKLHLTATDAVKSKEDTEIKCQNKIADMVALMEKHKNQYDKMVDEKDAELDEKKRKDMEATANRTSLELALSQQNIENDRLKEQLKKEMNERETEALRTPSWSSTNIVSATPRIKSYRIRTPPSTGKSVPWGKSTLELDPKSDSSEHNDLLIQSPAIQKSPGSTLKLAAMKRMRDAGWTSVTGAEKKKKKTVEKIFA
ncbi:synaptonemal complex protein 1 [Salvelinus namaycush]|uniref:Synaptonemal complex protein 1 n=1 Tax=Salvelinus namaycush TaxID=8040 RepID=A0A8U0QDL2_SALNM|nr:synaptonemal complex protein 1 [Salvelinus namaycush]